MAKNAKDASSLGAIGVCDGESSGDDNDHRAKKVAQSTTELKEPTTTPDSSISKKAPKARKSFGAPSSKKPATDSPRSSPQTKQTVFNHESHISTQNVLPVIPLVVNSKRKVPPEMAMKPAEARPPVLAPMRVLVGGSAMNGSERVESFDSIKAMKTETRTPEDTPSPTSSNAIAANGLTSLSSISSIGSTKANKSAITVTATGPSVGHTLRVVRLPASSFRANPQREVLLNGLLERKVAALKTESAQKMGKRSLSPTKSQKLAPKKKRGRKSEGAQLDHKPSADPETPVEPPPRRDGRPRRSAAPKSFKDSLKLCEYDEEATTSDSDTNDREAKTEEKAKPVVSATQPPMQRIVRTVNQNQPGGPFPTMTIIPRIVPASPAGFDKSLEQLLQTPVTLFQCQLCGIYLPRKDVTLSHIKRLHRVEDDQRAANNCVMIKKGRAQATPLGNEQLRVIKKPDADGISVPSPKVVQKMVIPKSAKLEKMDEVKTASGTEVQQGILSNPTYRCQQCHKLFDSRQSALTHYQLAHSS